MKARPRRYLRPTIPDVVLVEYKDDATAFNGLKKGTIQGKGVINNRVYQLPDEDAGERTASPPTILKRFPTVRRW